MPGLNQLKQFNADLLAIGDEVRILASRGERPIAIPIPRDVKSEDDSDDFITGLPDLEDDKPAAEQEQQIADEDFSDITGETKAAPAVEKTADSGLDFAALLNPIAETSDASDDAPPDLSNFMDSFVEEEEPEPEPEEPALADLGLEDLLKSSGFDMDSAIDDTGEAEFDFLAEAEMSAPSPEPVVEPEPENDIIGAPNLDFLNDIAQNDADTVTAAPDLSAEAMPDFGSGLDDLGDIATDTAAPDLSAEAMPDFGSGLDDLGDMAADTAAPDLSAEAMPDFGSGLDDLGDMTADTAVPDLSAEAMPDAPSQTQTDYISDDDSDFSYDGNAIDMTLDLPDDIAERDAVVEPESEADAAGAQVDDLPVDDFVLEEAVPLEVDTNTVSLADGMPVADEMSVSMDDVDLGADLGDIDFKSDDLSMDSDVNLDVDSLLSGLDAGGDIGGVSLGDESAAVGGLDMPQADSAETSDAGENALGEMDFNLPTDDGQENAVSDTNSLLGGLDLGETPAPSSDGFDDLGVDAAATDSSQNAGFDDFNFDMGGDALGGDGGLADNSFMDGLGIGDMSIDDNAPVEKFDTSEIEGLDFSIPATDSQISSSDGMDDGIGDFEIPGFSDIDTAPEVNKTKIVVPQAVVKEPDDDSEEDREPNTLTSDEYKKYLNNLSDYPLNVRIAVEDLLVKNEFTDDAEFEVVQKVLRKVPARQLAGYLEKMLDISISVPRDFERRSAAEYEAIKASFQYQLKNKILPVAIVSLVAAAVLFGLAQFVYRIIYKPVMANSLYKQGYALIESNDYPQSEILFEQATKYDLQKNWFYKYAQGYRTHKQYDRAEKMYNNILNVYNHEKQAGLEYADMEAYDLANYEKAEQIIRRDVLDYHVNDAEALLALGDVFLEWATERDSEKFEDARTQYASLMELYGQTNLYLSRMMRYFVRTDNLREVLQLKEHFIAQRKNPLSGQDWTEMSGYLLDKLFGPLPPADEYLRARISDVRQMLVKATENDPTNPVAMYNMARYYIYMHNGAYAKAALQKSIDTFEGVASLRERDVYKYIDSYRLLGELLVDEKEYLTARETYTDGIALYQSVHDSSGLVGNENIGLLFADMGDIDYFVSGNNDNAYRNYVESIKLGNDTPEIQYKIGYIQYHRQDYDEALNAFLRSSDGAAGDNNLLLALANTLSLRGNNYAAEGYYSRLMSQLEAERVQREVLLPQVKVDDAEFVELMMRASNNYGVALHNLASQTGSSARNAAAMVQLSLSMRAWDALTRNQETFLRIGGKNLAEQNIGYMSRPLSQFEPAIYTDLPRTLDSDEGI